MKKYKRSGYGIKFTVIENGILPPHGFSAINPGVIFTRDMRLLSDNTMRHEAIHTLQAREMLYIPYYLLYGLEFLVKSCICRSFDTGYRSVSFEQEAYRNSQNLNYRQERKRFAFAKCIFKMYVKS